MKAKPYQVSALVPQIQKDYLGALIFGPDLGLVQEISEKMARLIVSDLSDPFCVSKITPQKIKEIQSIILDEANAPALLGGRKLIWLKDADNNSIEAIEDYFQHTKTNSFLLITAGNLTKNSSIRQFFDSEPRALSIACYLDEAKDVAGFIREILSEYKIQVSPPALALLVERLCENRLVTKQELNKLINYLGNKKQVDLSDVQNIITDTKNSSVDQFCCAIATGDREKAEKEYHLMLQNGENPVSIIRILYIYFNRLLDAADTMEHQGIEAGVKKIMKPAQFRWETSFQKQLKIWKKSFILKVLNLLLDAEKQAKSTGLPAELILGRTIVQIASVAQKYSM